MICLLGFQAQKMSLHTRAVRVVPRVHDHQLVHRGSDGALDILTLVPPRTGTHPNGWYPYKMPAVF